MLRSCEYNPKYLTETGWPFPSQSKGWRIRKSRFLLNMLFRLPLFLNEAKQYHRPKRKATLRVSSIWLSDGEKVVEILKLYLD
jgi:hypothetical protein